MTLLADQFITQAEFARRHNVTRQAVNDWVTRGVVRLHAGGIDEAEALADISNVRDPARKSKLAASVSASPTPETTPEGQGDLPTAEQASSFHKAKTRREQAEAEMAELKLAQMSGDLLDRAETIKAITDTAATLSSTLDLLADKLASRVAADSNEHSCHTLIVAEVDSIKHDMANALVLVHKDKK